MSVGGLALLCVLLGLIFLSLAISGTVVVCSVVIGSLINYWFSSRRLAKQNPSADCQLDMKAADLAGLYQE